MGRATSRRIRNLDYLLENLLFPSAIVPAKFWPAPEKVRLDVTCLSLAERSVPEPAFTDPGALGERMVPTHRAAVERLLVE
jgi:hypothetical protein